jgi:transportin-3
LVQEDRRQVYEAIAYVISAMPMEKAAESLRTFSLDILSQIHAVTGKTTPITKQGLKEIGCKLPTTYLISFLIDGSTQMV